MQPVGSALCDYALSSHPVLNWQLVARKGGSSYIKLYYRVQGRESGNPAAFWGQAEVDVKLAGDVWQITGYDAVY